jgi:hypothetical protein
MCDWFDGVPGVSNEIQLLAWKHRNQSPWILARTFKGDVDGRGIRIRMTPRSFWEEDPRFLEKYHDEFRDILRHQFDEASFETHKHFMFTQIIVHGGRTHMTAEQLGMFNPCLIRGTEIVEALTLTAATRAKDLADAFAWIETRFTSQRAEEILHTLRQRSLGSYGSAMLRGSVPVATRAFNNEAACLMMASLGLEFDVRLTGTM